MIFFLLAATLVYAQTTTPRSTSTSTVLANTTTVTATSSSMTATTRRPCSTLGCACDASNRCLEGYVCQGSKCISIGVASCEPASESAQPDDCILQSRDTAPYSCQQGKCKPCFPRDHHCTCRATDRCVDHGDKCVQIGTGNRTRCFPRSGCLGCVCIPDTNTCDDGICVGGACQLPTTTPMPTITVPGCAQSEHQAWSSCDSAYQTCLTKLAKVNGTVDDYCKCTVARVACIFARPATCDYYDTFKTKALDYCRSVVNCSSCEPTQPPPPNLACDAAVVQRGAMCLYPGSMRDDTSRLVMAAQVGVISPVTMRICASLREYLVCSKRILDAGTCDTSSLDITYYPSLGGPTRLCSYNTTAALLKDIECDMCTALSEPVVPGVPSSVPGGTGSIVATNDVSAGERLAAVCGLGLAAVLCFVLRMSM